MNEIQDKDLPCYECLCLATCKSKLLEELVKCELFFNFANKHYNDKEPSVLKLLKFIGIKGHIYKSE